MRNETVIQDIDYCDGWHDHANMGISVIGAYDYITDRYRVFCKDNFHEFLLLAGDGRDPMVSFNGIGFDNKVLRSAQIDIPDSRCYDILRELWSAVGLGPEFNYKTHGGFGLERVGKANFSLSKTGNGAIAPVEWQRGNIGNVVDYCLNDVKLTKMTFDRIVETGGLRNPCDSSHFITMSPPRL